MEKYQMQNSNEDLMKPIVATVTPPVEVGYGNIEAPKMSDEQAQELCETIADKYLVKVNKDAPGCCIDGRGCVHRLNGEQTEPGPKVAGGPLITSYAAAELIGWFEPNDSTSVEERMSLINDKLEDAGIVCGGHCDTSAMASGFSENKTGCGANDKLPTIIENIGKNEGGIIGVGTGLIITSSDTYKPELADTIVKNAVNKPVKEWQAKALINQLGGKESSKIEVLASEEDETHGHHEVIVLANPNEGTTVDRDRVIEEEGIQVFALDTWYIDKLANALARGPESEHQFESLKHAMTAYQVSTLVTLGSGSHRIGVLEQL